MAQQPSDDGAEESRGVREPTQGAGLSNLAQPSPADDRASFTWGPNPEPTDGQSLSLQET
jgi:hypothetical protein